MSLSHSAELGVRVQYAGVEISAIGTAHVTLDEGFIIDGSSTGYFDVANCFEKQFVGHSKVQVPPDPPPSSWYLRGGN